MTCRAGKGPRLHFCSAYHRNLVEGYHLAVEEQNRRAEDVTLGYATELAHYFHPLFGTERRLTFKDWLIWSADETRAAWSEAA